MIQLAVHHDAGADSRADGNERTGIVAARGAAPPFADDGEVHVIFDDDRYPQRPPQDLRHRHLGPALEVRSERHHHTADAIDDAGRAGHDGEQPIGWHARVAQQLAKIGRNLRQQIRRGAIGRRRDDALADRLTSEVRNRQPRLGRTDIDAGHEPVTRVELHERGTAAAARRRSAEIRRGQASRLNHFAPRERPRLRDREREHAVQIERSKVRGMARVDVGVRLTLADVARISCHAFENSL